MKAEGDKFHELASLEHLESYTEVPVVAQEHVAQEYVELVHAVGQMMYRPK